MAFRLSSGFAYNMGDIVTFQAIHQPEVGPERMISHGRSLHDQENSRRLQKLMGWYSSSRLFTALYVYLRAINSIMDRSSDFADPVGPDMATTSSFRSSMRFH